eukprot:766797-Hanusia_phi.AAC.8
MSGEAKLADGLPPLRRSKIIPGDIVPHVLPSMKRELEKDNWRDAFETACALELILHSNIQLPELIALQSMLQELFKKYVHERTAMVHNCLERKELIVAREFMNGLLDASQYAQRSGIPQSLAYKLLKNSRELSLKSQENACFMWIRYMRKKIKRHKDPVDVAVLNSSIQRYLSTLQASFRRYLTWKRCKILPESLRRFRIRSEYIMFIEARRQSAAVMEGFLRRSILSKKLSLLQEIVDINETNQIKTINQNILDKGHQKANHKLLKDLQSEYIKRRQGERSQEQEHHPKSKRQLDLNSIPPEDLGTLVGLDVRPEVGMRVKIATSALAEYPELAKESGGGLGTITWVDPEDADGDGETGDICEVEWDKTGAKGDYRTGFEGDFRLSAVTGYR